jgi:ATP-binding cassette, subfamily B, bacterial
VITAAPASLRQTGAYRRLLRYGRPYRTGWALIIIVTLLSAGFSVLQPWPMKVLVDYVLGSAPMPESLSRIREWLPGAASGNGLLVWVVLSALIVFAVNSTVDILLTVTWIKVGQRMVYDLAVDLFAHLQRLSLRYHSRSSVGDSMSRITADSWCVYNVLAALLFTPGLAIATATGMIVLMARMDGALTLLSIAVAPFMAFSSYMFRGRTRAVSRLRREIESRMQSHVQQTLTGMPVVQAFTQEERTHRVFREFAEAAIDAQRRGTLVSSLAGLGNGLITTLGTALILWLGAKRVVAGELTVGSLLVFLAYLGSLQAQLKALTGLYNSLHTAGANVDRVMEILQQVPDVTDRPNAIALPRVHGHVRLDNVVFAYEPQSPVLRGVSLDALPGQTVAIIGSTGAGKSTLVSLIPRLFDVDGGRVLIDGHDVREVQIRSLRSQVSLLLQEPFLSSVSVAENIAYGRPGASRAEIEQAARVANAHDFITRMTEGYESVLGERGMTLSGGERQRLAIARAVLKDAPILILDEPTSALDAETEASLLEALSRLMVGRTTFIIAHRLSTVRNADSIVVLEHGNVVEQGTHDQLIAAGGAYHRYFALNAPAAHSASTRSPDGARP